MKQTRSIALMTGAAASFVTVLGGAFSGGQFFRSYLFAWLFWLGLALGCFALTMLHHLVGGKWGFATRRFYEAGLGTLPLMAVLAVPLIFGLRHVYGWAIPVQVAADPVLQHRHAYLNPTFFIVRIIVYFAVWLWLARALLSGSRAQDGTTDAEPTRRLRVLSAPGIIIYVLSATFAYVDLILSLEPDWYSTIFLILIVIGQTLASLALGIVCLRLFAKDARLERIATPACFHDLGNLLLAFVMLWAYMAFSQLLIIWSGNLPEEIAWYLHRSTPGWKAVALLLGFFHFAIPFALLLSRGLKHQIELLCMVAGLVLVAHAVDVYWLVVPSITATFRGSAAAGPHWIDVTSFVAIGGFWTALFLSRLAAYPLVPRNDPRFVLDQPLEGVSVS
jgi:hypothetical protein